MVGTCFDELSVFGMERRWTAMDRQVFSFRASRSKFDPGSGEKTSAGDKIFSTGM